MPHVQVRPSRDLRNHYNELAELAKNSNPVIITNRGKGDTVLISMEDFSKYEDFIHHQYIVNELAKAEAEASDPSTKWHTHEDVWDGIWGRRNKNV